MSRLGKRQMLAGVRVALPLLVAALLLGGCGGGSKAPLSSASYLTQMMAIEHELSGLISTTAAASTPKAAAAALVTVQSDLRSAVTQLQAISPPAKAKAAHAELITAAGELANELAPVIAKLKGGNLAALATVTSLKGFADLLKASAAFTKAGFTFAL
ncbi:MAG TPA: hypothetical protein VMV08_00935 [Gaiellaceae bacterium]|nr:hypothetical protein [Gaiellaceae bacterium]